MKSVVCGGADKYCSPTRSSFLTGRASIEPVLSLSLSASLWCLHAGLPVHVNQDNQCNDALSSSGADLRMTLLPQKLKTAGFETAAVGKW